MIAELTPVEQTEFARCEEAIKEGLHRAWQAMRTIWAKELYRAEFDSFESYVETRWGFSRQRAYQFIDAADLLDEVSTSGLQIPNERVARAVLEVPEQDRIPVLLMAHQASGGKLDSGWIRSAAEVRQEINISQGLVDDDGGMKELHRAVVDNRLERLNRQRQHIADSVDGKFKQERLIDNAPCTVVRVSGATGIVVLKFAPEIARHIALVVGELRVTMAQPKVQELESEDL